MILLAPILVFGRKMRKWCYRFIPYRLPQTLVTPARIGKDGRTTILDIIFQDVDFTIVRPFPFITQEPYRRPTSCCSRNLRSHFYSAEMKSKAILSGKATGGIFCIFTLQLPIPTTFYIIRILYPFLSPLNNETSISNCCILVLIPLKFVVSNKALFITPLLAWQTIIVKLIMPYQGIAIIRWNCGKLNSRFVTGRIHSCRTISTRIFFLY